jgi:LPPG:FO 2-phospho-L-lactate transferase
MRIVTLAGGVGGARMARGFAALDTVELTVVVNVGDDDTIYGVDLSPDIDTVVYMLAGVEGQFGWGRRDDTWHVMSELERFDIDTSFRLGDQDLALNLFRSHLLRTGVPLSSVTRAQCSAFDLSARVLPATDDPVRTKIQVADSGSWIDFQTYFVTRQHQDRVAAVSYEGIEAASPAPGVVESIERADAIVIAPSNPHLSILPVLTVPGVRSAITGKQVVAVSPFVGGATIKGPAADIMRALGHQPDPTGLTEVYGDVLTHLVVDPGDAVGLPGVDVLATDIMIGTWEEAGRLAKEIIAWLS